MDYSRTSQERAIIKAHDSNLMLLSDIGYTLIERPSLKGRQRKNDSNCSASKENKETERRNRSRSLRHYCSWVVSIMCIGEERKQFLSLRFI